jgi:hypothetical protein
MPGPPEPASRQIDPVFEVEIENAREVSHGPWLTRLLQM